MKTVTEMAVEKTPSDPTLGFRCPQADIDRLYANAESRGWTKDTVMRALVANFNERFEAGPPPQWPLRVIGSSDWIAAGELDQFSQKHVAHVCDEILKRLPVRVNSPTEEAFEKGRRARSKKEPVTKRDAAHNERETQSPARP